MSLDERLRKARESIITAFAESPNFLAPTAGGGAAPCTGTASEVVHSVDPQAAAWGQHLDTVTVQRGIHGVAAAIYVLSQDGREAYPTIRALVRYIRCYEEIESKLSAAAVCANNQEHQRRSFSNVIKLAELWLALEGVPDSCVSTQDLRQQYAQLLTSGAVDVESGPPRTKAWGFQLGEQPTKPDVIPTSFAVMALAKSGADISPYVEYLKWALENDNSLDPFAATLVLYSLVFFALPNGRTDPPLITDAEMKAYFDRMWNRLYPFMAQDLDSKAEYYSGGGSRYVHIPWQFYLISVAAHVRPRSAFVSSNSKSRIESLLSQTETEDHLFQYPLGGLHPSSRTNAIAVAILERLAQDYRHRPIRYWFASKFYRAQDTLHSRAGTLLVRLVAIVCLIVAFVFAGWKSFDPASIVSGIISSLLLLLITAGGGRNNDSL